MKVVVDTNVLISALLSPAGPPAQILNLVLNGRLTVLYDNRMLSEYREVMRRPKFRFEADAVEALLEFIGAEGEYVVAEPQPAPIKDEDDRAFYEVALSGGARRLVTGNASHYPRDKRIVSPAEFLRSYRQNRARKGDQD
jgi:putative PIN family toxin of toxin-antitoxin system